MQFHLVQPAITLWLLAFGAGRAPEWPGLQKLF
jgi:hypothetical protein